MKKQFTDRQATGFLKEAEAGTPIKELCRKHGFSDAAFYGWRSRVGGMVMADLTRPNLGGMNYSEPVDVELDLT